MRRNGHQSESSESCSSSGWLSKTLSMVGGIGIGAGLLYLLDPDKGKGRRNQILSGASDLASHAKDYAGEALGSVGSKIGDALGSARDYAGKQVHHVQDYASDRMDDARAYAQKQVFGETRAEHRVGVTICALSSMALGAALMYAFDPASGKNRRRIAREKASDLASQAGTYAKQAGGAIKSGAERMGERMGVGGGNVGSESQPSQGAI